MSGGTSEAVVVTDAQVSQVMAYLRGAAANRRPNQAIYMGAYWDEILGGIWAGLNGTVSRAVMAVALDALVGQGKITITKGPLGSYTLWVNKGLWP